METFPVFSLIDTWDSLNTKWLGSSSGDLIRGGNGADVRDGKDSPNISCSIIHERGNARSEAEERRSMPKQTETSFKSNE
ncbi:hypothetical protein KUCAC02_036910 [Chaenocephalus aceratus]|nr:hypothetical protein KUCAC02_036910 [Chaenocephalus aceratus]